MVADLIGKIDQLTDLARIGIDEIDSRKGQRYLMVVVAHDSGRLVRAAEGRNQYTVPHSSAPSASAAPHGSPRYRPTARSGS
jgi:transposase